MSSLLEVRDLQVRFGDVRAVDGVSFELPRGPFGLGLVGESGSGKTTIARAVARLVLPAGGTIRLDGEEVQHLRGGPLRQYRRAVQIVFQDADSSLDPRMTVEATLREPLIAHRIVGRDELAARVRKHLAEVELDPEHAGRYPHQLSGGQRQRVSLARALAVGPRLMVLDEPTSALDTTVQARMLELIGELRHRKDLAYLLISHNLAVVARLCEETAVLYLGRIVERGPTAALLAAPVHPYTQALRTAVPQLAGRRTNKPSALAGVLPDPAQVPAGCAFHPRCPLAQERCRVERPLLRALGTDHTVACHFAEDALAEWAAAPC